jgi:hypothetical protein
MRRVDHESERTRPRRPSDERKTGKLDENFKKIENKKKKLKFCYFSIGYATTKCNFITFRCIKNIVFIIIK